MNEKKRIERAKQIFKEIISICYESDSKMLHAEVLSIERGIRTEMEVVDDVVNVANQVQISIETLLDDFDEDDIYKIDEMVAELIDLEE